MFKSNKTKWIIFDIISMIGLKLTMDSFGIPQRSIEKMIGSIHDLIENLKKAFFNFASSMEHPIIYIFDEKLSPINAWNNVENCFNAIKKFFEDSLIAKNVVVFALIDIGFGNLISYIAAFIAYICFIGVILNFLVKGSKVETRAIKCFRAVTFANIVQVAYIIIFDVAFIITNVDGLKYLRLNFPIFSLILSVFGIIALKFSTFGEFKTAVVNTVNKYTHNSSIPTVTAVSYASGWKCPSCGKQNSDDDPFCTGCGASKANSNAAASLPGLPDSTISNNNTSEAPSPANTASETQNSPSTKTENSDLEQIKQLKELLDMGAITQEEFEQKKKEILKLDK